MSRGATDAAPAACHEVGLRGRVLVRGEAEQPCLLLSVQGREARLRVEASGADGRVATAVAYVDLVGRLEGRAVVEDGVLVLAIEAPEPKWARLRQQFAILAAMPAGQRDELRGHARIVPEEREVAVTLPHGVPARGVLRDLSRSGAAVEARAAVEVGDKVAIGSTRGTVVRVFEGGFAVAFARLLPLALEAFGSGFRL